MKPRGEGKRSKPGRFRLVQRISSRRRVSSETDRQRSDVLPKGVHVLRETTSFDETVSDSIDVLGRESIISLESEKEACCEGIIDNQEERDLVTMGSQEADLSVSIHTWRKYHLANVLLHAHLWRNHDSSCSPDCFVSLFIQYKMLTPW